MAQMKATTVSPISVYAELLPNIGQVSVAATLPSPADSSTKIVILEQGLRLEISHKEESIAVPLPAAVYPNTHSVGANSGASVLSLRLPLLNRSLSRHQQPLPEDQVLPWSALDIEAGSPICCRHCGSEIVQHGVMQAWKDLPSDNWAEMMEFWHCHKPHDHSQHSEDSLEKKGYGASSAIKAQPGIGLVDHISFLVSEPDCRGLMFAMNTDTPGLSASGPVLEQSPDSKFLEVSCGKCKAEVGMFTTSTSSLKLFKWAVSITTTKSAPARGPTSSECLAAILLSSISQSGSAKSVVAPYIPPSQSHESSNSALNIWVLNSNVSYTASSFGGKRTALKVLYRGIDTETGNQLVESMKADVQDISFPHAALKSALSSLNASPILLPERDRTFKDWAVGLLDRWDPGPM